MSEFNKNAFGELVARSGCGLLIFAIFVLILVSMCSCRTTKLIKETEVKTDTVTVHRDSIIIRERLVPVEVQLPPSVHYVEIPITHDTTSVLDDGLYISTAAVKNGSLIHSLKAHAGVKLKTSAQVADTTRTSDHQSNITNQKVEYKTELKEVNRLYWWQKLLMTIGGAALLAIGFWITQKVRHHV